MLVVLHLFTQPTDLIAEFSDGKHALFIEHTLEINDVLISAALLHKVSTEVSLDHFIHERVLKRKPFKTSWQGMSLTVIPDAFLRFRTPGGAQRFLLEHDRGTEEQHRFRMKLRAYVALMREEPTPVLFTTFNGQIRLEQMRAWAQVELQSESSQIRSRFVFTSLTRPPVPLETWLLPIWQTAFSSQPQAVIAA